jgi:hypothetical protein
MRKIFWLVLVGFLVGAPAFAQVTFQDASSTYGQVKGIQVLGASVTESGGTGIINVSTLIPAATIPVITITGTTDTDRNVSASINLVGTSPTTKKASIKIHYTGITGAATTGWLQVFSDPG